MFQRDLVRPPRLWTSTDGERDRHATWLELFYDLAFVAAVAQLSHRLSGDYTLRGLVDFVALFVPVWWGWTGHTFYLTRFDSDDLIHRLLALGQIAAVAVLAVHINRGLEDQSAEFALSYVVLRLILIVEYQRAGHYIPKVRPLVQRYCLGFGVAALLWTISAFVPPPWRFMLWLVGVLVDFAAPLSSSRLHIQFPPHVMHLPERFGLFTIIVLGEAMVLAITGMGSAAMTPYAGLMAWCGLLVAFCLWWGYFNGVRGSEFRTLNTLDDVQKYLRWIYIHLPLTMSIVIAGVGIHAVILEQPWTPVGVDCGWMVTGSAAVAMVCLHVIFMASPGLLVTPQVQRFLQPHMAIIVLIALAGALTGLCSGGTLLLIVTAAWITQVLLTLREVGPPEPGEGAASYIG
ncbi:MAG: low temperature requirement protein A [bacterium]